MMGRVGKLAPVVAEDARHDLAAKEEVRLQGGGCQEGRIGDRVWEGHQRYGVRVRGGQLRRPLGGIGV